MTRPLSKAHIRWFEDRHIDPEVASRFGVYSAMRVKTGTDEHGDPQWDIQPNPAGDVLVYPYMERDREVNWKARGRGKFFWQKAGGRKTFWNSDVLDDPALGEKNGMAALVIVEGENDGLVAIECGHPWTVSVPDGAPAHRDKDGNIIEIPTEVDPNHDSKFGYVTNNWERLGKVRRIILATDDDEPGMRLRLELARRLGEPRCFVVDYPKQKIVPVDGGGHRACKDLNEVKQYLGPDFVREMIRNARPYPVAGLFKLADYVENGPRTYYTTGFPTLDDKFKLWQGAFVVVSGTPASGKSAFVDQLAYNMAACHGWRPCIATFEEDVNPELRDKLRAFHIDKNEDEWTAQDKAEADRFINSYFTFITADQHESQLPGVDMEDDVALTIDWILEKAAEAVIRDGCNLLIIDPWNEIEHAMKRGENSDTYLNNAIRKVKAFRKRWGVTVIIIAHPTKDGYKNQKAGESMTMYDINGGATWANKAEIGIIVERPDPRGNTAIVHTKKIKFHKSGKLGETYVNFNIWKRLYEVV